MSARASKAHLWFYQDSVDKLREIFNRLTLIMEGIACVRISDPEILRILIERLDVDGIGAISENVYVFITIEQPKLIRNIRV